MENRVVEGVIAVVIIGLVIGLWLFTGCQNKSNESKECLPASYFTINVVSIHGPEYPPVVTSKEVEGTGSVLRLSPTERIGPL